jgi:SPP1 gp7 family putative phage head morphogenesis protein
MNVADKLRTQNLIAMRRAAHRVLQRKRRLPRPPALLFPLAAERGYVRDLRRLVAAWHAVVVRHLMPELPAVVRAAQAQRPSAARTDAWEESKHPRDEDGEFSSSGGGGSSSHGTAEIHGKKAEKPKDVVKKASLSHAQHVVLKDYKENNYTLINSYLRNPDKAQVRASSEIRAATEAEKKRAAGDIKKIDKAFEKSSLTKDTVVHRGMTSEVLHKDPEKLVGRSIPEEGYLSTTTHPGKVYGQFEANHVVFNIKAKAGTKALDMDQVAEGSTQGEDEVLFPRGGRLKITGFKRVGNAVHYSAELEYDEPKAKTDAADDDHLKRLLDLIRSQITSLGGRQRTEDLARRLAIAVATANGGQVDKAFRDVLGVDLLRAEPWLANEMRLFVDSQVQLIEAAGQRYFDDVSAQVFDGARQGLTAGEISDRLQERFGVAERRAAFIARNQVAQFNGQLTKLRQTQAGVSRYTWRTSRDERVRATHRVMEGKVCDWDSPPTVGGSPAHPGEQINCRCWAEPVMEDFAP